MSVLWGEAEMRYKDVVHCSNDDTCSAWFEDWDTESWNTRPIEDALRKDIMELQQERYAKEIETRATIDALRAKLDLAVEAMNNVKGLISSDAHPIAMIVQAALAKLQGEPTFVVYPVDKMAPIYRPFGWHGHVGVDWIVVPVHQFRASKMVKLLSQRRTVRRMVGTAS